MSSDTDWVAVTISPRWNSACTIEAGFASILSAKSASDEPRASRIDRPVAARQRHAADRRRLHVVEFLTALLLGLATLAGRTALAPEGTGGAAATTTAATGTGTAATGTTGRAAGPPR